MNSVPPSGGGALTSLHSGDGPVQPPQGGLAGETQFIPLASQGFRGDANRMDLVPTNLPFDFASTYRVDNKERLACSATLKHYIKIGLVKELPSETFDGLWSTFFLVSKKGTNKSADASIFAGRTCTSGMSTSRWRGFIRFNSSSSATIS